MGLQNGASALQLPSCQSRGCNGAWRPLLSILRIKLWQIRPGLPGARQGWKHRAKHTWTKRAPRLDMCCPPSRGTLSPFLMLAKQSFPPLPLTSHFAFHGAQSSMCRFRSGSRIYASRNRRSLNPRMGPRRHGSRLTTAPAATTAHAHPAQLIKLNAP